MPSRTTPRIIAAVASLSTAAAACTGLAEPARPPVRPDPAVVRVAFVGDLSFDGATQVVSPAQDAIQLAFDRAAEGADRPPVPELVPMDTGGDPDRALSFATEIANDPTVVAAIAAPFWEEPVAFGDRLDAAGVPTVSLSTRGDPPTQLGWSRWWRAVASGPDATGSLVAAVRAETDARGSVCLVGDGSEHAAWLVEPLRRSLGGRVAADLTIEALESASGAADVIRTAGCSTVVWTGFDPLASALVEAMREGGLEDVRLVGSEAIKGERFLTASDGGADGTVVTCPCVDLTTSTRIDDQRFVHDFQSAVGSSPGVFAVEGWDVASMLLERIRAGATDRDALAEALDGATYDGLAGPYAFGEEGELGEGSARVVAYRAEGLRWLPVAADQGAVALPVRTRGYLAVGSCRLGSPFRYRRAGEPAGFEVELIERVAGRLGLVPVWSELPCDDALRALDAGRLDAVLAPAGALTAGTPVSRVLLALDAALVVRGDAPPTTDPAATLGPGDTVGVVEESAVTEWAEAAFDGSGARLRSLSRAEAYERLARGGLDAVADVEYAAWAATERRPGLWVSGGRPTDHLDVVAGSRRGTEVLAAIDRALGRLIASGRYALLFGAYFPGAPIPAATGGSGAGS